MLRPRLIAVTDTTVAPRGVLEARLETLLAAAVPGSVMVQLRDRQLPDRERIAGFVHIGRPKDTPEDRPRPPLAEIATRFGGG